MKKITIHITFLFACFSLFAQNNQGVNDTISNTVVVTREYNPTIDDAEKISLRPEEKAQSLTQPPIRYIVTPSIFQPQKETEEIKPEPVAVEDIAMQLNRNFVKFGIGTRTSLYNEIFYNAYNSETHNLNLYGFHNSSFGHVDLANGKNVKAPYSKSSVIMAYENRMRYSVLSSTFQFNHLGVRYYGLDSVHKSGSYYLKDNVSVVSGNTIKPSDQQSYTNFNFNIGLRSQNAYAYEFRYNTVLDFHSHSNRQELMEYKTGLNAEFFTPINDNNFGIKLKSNYYFYREPDNLFDNGNFMAPDVFTATVIPNFIFRNDNGHLLVGVNASTVQTSKDQSGIVVAPELDASLKIIEDLFSIYAKVTGGNNYTDLKTLSGKNPFIAHNILLEPNKNLIQSQIGLNGYIHSDLFFDIKFGFDVFKNRAFFNNEVYPETVFGYSFSDRFTANYDDGSLFFVQSNILYQGLKNSEFGVNFKYNSFSLKTLELALHEPEFNLGIYASRTFQDKLTMRAGYEYKSWQYAGGGLFDFVEIPEVHDVNFETLYEHSSYLTSFIKVQNLLNKDNFLWHGYPMQGITFLFGAKYNF